MDILVRRYVFLLASLVFVVCGNQFYSQVTQVGSAETAYTNTGTITINKPTGVADGDLMLAYICQKHNGAGSVSDASLAGWTVIKSYKDSYNKSTLLYKVASSEGADYTFTLNNTSYNTGTILAFTNVDVSGGLDESGSASSGPFDNTIGTFAGPGTSGSSTATTITTLNDNSVVLMFSGTAYDAVTYSGSTTTSPGALTELIDYGQAASGDYSSLCVSWGTQTTAGATGSGSVTLTGGSAFSYSASIMISLKEACNGDTPTATSDSPLCNTNVTLTATGSASANNTWYWQTTSSGTATTDPATSTYSAASTGTYYIRSYYSVDDCWSTASSIAVTVDANPTTSAAGDDLTIPTCATVTLGANTPSTGTGAWTVTSGPSTSTAQFASTSDPNTVFTPAGGAGTYVLRWTISNGSCTDSYDEVSVTVSGATYSGTLTVGISGCHFTSLTDALTKLGSCGYTGNIILELQTNFDGTSTTETFPLDFASSSVTPGSSTTITIRPASDVASTLSISGSHASYIIYMNGTDYVTFDGRPGGAGSNKYLTIENTSTTGDCAVKLIADATNNTFQYCTLKALDDAATSAGVVWISTATTTGNDDNTFDYCVFDGGCDATASPSSGVAKNGIYSYGTTAKQNSNITVSNCEFKDIWSVDASASSVFINLDAYNDAWTITGNSFYQTNTRTATGAHSIYGVKIDDGDGYTISSNYFGGSAASCSGTWTQNSTSSNYTQFYGIYLTVGTTTATSVQGNTFNNFTWDIKGSNNWACIYVTAGDVNIGTSSANTIGATTGTGTITLVNTTGTPNIYGIYTSSTGTVSIQNNTIGSIATSAAVGISFNFYGIYTASSGSFTVSSNYIGSASTSNSVQFGDGSTTTGVNSIYCIYNTATGTISISSNTIKNVTAYGTSSSKIYGVYTSASPASLTISSNSISYLENTGTGNMAGIYQNTNISNTVSSNTIENITSSNFGGTFYGIYEGITSTAATATLSSNTIQNITFSKAATLSINAIYVSSSGYLNADNTTISNIISSDNGNYQSKVTGFYFGGKAMGTLKKNSISGLQVSNITTTGTPILYGVYATSASTTDFYFINNYISLNNNAETTSNASMYGIYTVNGQQIHMYYNTIKLYGSTASGGGGPVTSCYHHNASTNYLVAAKNNIFQNNVSSNTRYVIYEGTAHGSGEMDYNFYVLNNTAASTYGYQAGTKTMATFNAAAYGGTNSTYVSSDSGTDVTIGALGSISEADANVVGQGVDLSNSSSYPDCQDDIQGTVGVRSAKGGTKGCYEQALCSSSYVGPLTWAIGSGGGDDFATLTAAITALENCGFSGIITMELQSTYNAAYSAANETYPINLSSLVGVNSSKYIKIQPASGVAASISGSNSGGNILYYNGGDYIQIDGNGSADDGSLTIENTAAAAASNRAIYMENNATNNTISNCTIKADNSSTTVSTAGVVFVGDGSTDNTANTFSGNTLTYASASTACLYVSYNTTGSNSSNTLSTNNFVDFTERGIWMSTGTSSNTISSNDIYRDAAITGGTTVGLIYIDAGDGYTISSNDIGGQTANCGTGYFTTSTTTIYGIYLAGSGATTNTISSNNVKYIASSAAGATNVYGIYTNYSSTTIDIYSNDIEYLAESSSSTGSTHSVTGVSTSGTSTTINFYKNKVLNLVNAASGSNTYYTGCSFGITTSSTLNAYNNYISVGETAITCREYGLISTSATAYILNNTIELLGAVSANYDHYCIKTITASSTNYIYNNILTSVATSSTSYYSACIYTISTATVNHDYNYYQFTGASSTCRRQSTTAYTFSAWEGAGAGLNGQNNTDLTLDATGNVTAGDANVTGNGVSLYTANAYGSSPAITDDIASSGRPSSGGFTIGCYELATSTITLAANAIAAADICLSSTTVEIQSFSLAVTTAAGNLTDLKFTTSGTYVQADISKYQLWYHTANDLSTASQLGTDLTPTGGNGTTETFAAFASPTLNSGSTYYFWITMDVAGGASDGNTIAVDAIATTDLTSTSTKAGSTSAGGTQTLHALPSVSVQPSAGSICVGGTYSPSITATGGVSLSYQWQFSTDDATWGSVSDGTPTNSTYTNGTTNNLSVDGSIAAGSAYYYRCVVSSTGTGCSSVNSSSAQLTINAVPSVSVQPSAGNICYGDSYAPSITATGGTSLTYQWQFSTDDATWGSVANGTPANSTYSNATTATLSESGNVAAGSAYYYRCVVSDAGSGCTTVNSNSAQLTINALPTITTAATPAVVTGVTYNAGAQTTSLTYTASTNSPTSYSIDWDATANTAGLTDQASTAHAFVGGGSSIADIDVPGGVAAATYSGTMTYTNANSCSGSQTLTLTISASGVTTFYYDGSGSMSSTANWGSNTDGTGSNPSDLTSGSMTFYILDNGTTTPSNDATWTLGASSKIIVGDGTNATNFTIGSGYTITGTVDVANNATLTITATTAPTFGTIDAGSTIVYNGGAAQTIASSTTFGSLTINNASGVSLTDDATVEGTLTLTSGNLTIPSSGTLTLGTTSANLTLSGGSSSSYIVTTDNTSTIKRYVNSNTTYVFPMGDATYYSPMTFTLNSNGGLANAYLSTYVVDAVVPGLVETDFTSYISRYWSVEQTGMTSPNYDISYTYDDTDITGTESTFVPVKVSSGTWYKPSNSTNITNGTGEGTGSVTTGTNTLSWTGLTTFSFDGGVGDEAEALPIDLVKFKAKQEGSKVRLDWITASEEDNDYFTVERSIDGKEFTELFRKDGAGVSTTFLYYFGYDNAPKVGVNYYRLKQKDFDGKYEYSQIESVDFKVQENQMSLKVYPNPMIDNSINLEFYAMETANYEVMLYDQVGKIIASETIQVQKGKNIKQFTVDNLIHGIYFLELIDSEKASLVKRKVEY